MNKKQDAKLAMYRATEAFCDENSTLIAAIPALQTAFTNFKTKVAAIIGTEQLVDVPLAGIVSDKTNAKQNLCRRAADIATIIYAFADANSNNTLREEVNFSYSKLLRTRDDQLAPRCRNIHGIGSANVSALDDYGIAAATLTELQNAIDNFSGDTPKSRNAVSNRKTLIGNLAALFKEADAILKNQMDRLVANFKKSHPDFVKTYESNRYILTAKTTTTQLKGTVTKKGTTTPIHNAAVTIVELGTTQTTDSQGKYSFKPAPHGEYTIRYAAEGFESLQVLEFEILMGEDNLLNVELADN